MISPLEIVLVAVLVGKNNFGINEVQYQVLDRYKSMSACTVKRNKLMRKPEKGITYVCLNVDYD